MFFFLFTLTVTYAGSTVVLICANSRLVIGTFALKCNHEYRDKIEY